MAYREYRDNISSYYENVFRCSRCAEGCITCNSPAPCLAHYNWGFRLAILTVSIMCAGFTIVLSCYLYHHRKVKVFKVASPIFLTITLLGCAIMYLEVKQKLNQPNWSLSNHFRFFYAMQMAAIFPILDVTSCIATKWTRHMGFCITYTALLMKTWRVSLTYRVKSAHKVKLTGNEKLLLLNITIVCLILFFFFKLCFNFL